MYNDQPFVAEVVIRIEAEVFYRSFLFVHTVVIKRRMRHRV
jgi:hypothetical protein